MTTPKQSQFELFPGASAQEPNTYKKPFLIKDLTLSAENIIVVAIIFVVAMVVFFSFGVERGKILALRPTQAPAPVVVAEIEPDVTSDATKTKLTVNQKAPAISPQNNDGQTAQQPEIKPTNISEDLRYTIQVASFKKEKEAQSLADKLEHKGHKTFVMPKGTYSIVCVGRFSGKNQAESYSRKIKDNYRDYVIRRL